MLQNSNSRFFSVARLLDLFNRRAFSRISYILSHSHIAIVRRRRSESLKMRARESVDARSRVLCTSAIYLRIPLSFRIDYAVDVIVVVMYKQRQARLRWLTTISPFLLSASLLLRPLMIKCPPPSSPSFHRASSRTPRISRGQQPRERVVRARRRGGIERELRRRISRRISSYYNKTSISWNYYFTPDVYGENVIKHRAVFRTSRRANFQHTLASCNLVIQPPRIHDLFSALCGKHLCELYSIQRSSIRNAISRSYERRRSFLQTQFHFEAVNAIDRNYKTGLIALFTRSYVLCLGSHFADSSE